MNNEQKVEYLKEVRKVIATPKQWTREKCAINAKKESVPSDSEEATCWCIYGAVNKVSYEFQENQKIKLMLNAEANKLGFTTAPQFNDHPSTTHADVLKLIDNAIETAEKANNEN